MNERSPGKIAIEVTSRSFTANHPEVVCATNFAKKGFIEVTENNNIPNTFKLGYSTEGMDFLRFTKSLTAKSHHFQTKSIR